MKTKILIPIILIALMTSTGASCKKKKTEPEPGSVTTPPEPANEEELITTFKLLLTDSATNSSSAFMFKDPDGDGGQPAFYGPDPGSQSDSVIVLAPNSTYYAKILLLDETKNPADTISSEVEEEGDEHMLFYNNGANSILNTLNPYTVRLDGPGITITYIDLDAGNPQRGIGLRTKWRTTSAKGSARFPLNITLKHQPGSKDGSYAPGESDVSVDFKVTVN